MKKTYLFLIFPVLFLFNNCSTDFDINAEWKDITVVYGLLNQADTIQYIKLNKGFLGNENAYVMALEPDSIFYQNAEVYLEPLNDTTHIYDSYGNVRRIQLLESTDMPKDSGIFAYDYNKIYYTTEPLNPEYNYMLRINIPGKETISSTTSLIDELQVTKPGNNIIHKVGLATSSGYLNYKVEWRAHEIGELYGLNLRCHYSEEYMGEVVEKYFDWSQSSKRKFLNDETMNLELDGMAFYNFVASQIEPGIVGTYRRFLGIDFIFTVAGEELAMYIDVNGPSDGIVQERPSFTNINNGIGVFSSRYIKTIPLVQLSPLSFDELSCGEITRHLRFADQYGNFDCL